MTVSILIGVVAILVLSSFTFLRSKPFGSLPKGERLERVLKSPNYRDGQFQNEEPTFMMLDSAGRKQSKWKSMWKFLFGKRPERLVPEEGEVKVHKTDLKHLDPAQDLYIWFGHSSYLLQLSGRTFLVDPVFYKGSPVSFVNRAFKGTDVWHPEDMPDRIDYLIISHDHWDHLDYQAVTEMRDRIGRVICPLGVGAHFERWGFSPDQLIELDWNETASLDFGSLPTSSFLPVVTCLPTRHFSGRGLKSNQSLWASFMLETPSGTVFVGGDGGYDGRFRRYHEHFPEIDLAILENGQYDERWAQIHTLPAQLATEMQELSARQYITVHHSKFCLANHPWDEPLRNEKAAAAATGKELHIVEIGEILSLDLKSGTLYHSEIAE